MYCPQTLPYTIQRGDNLYQLAHRYHTTVPQILSLNPSIEQRAGFTKRGRPSGFSTAIPMGLASKTSSSSSIPGAAIFGLRGMG